MNEPGWTARGSRVRGALALISFLEEDGREVLSRDEKIVIRPSEGLTEVDKHLALDLKPELMLLASFSHQQRAGIIRLYPDADLQDLQACRDALDAWERFTSQEKLLLDPAEMSVREVADLGRLRDRVGGTITAPEQGSG